MKNVIVVDDHEPSSRLAAKAAKAAGGSEVNVVAFTDPFLALITALEMKPDLLLVDFMMPKMDGVTFLRELRKQGIMSPAVILTGYSVKVNTALVPENNILKVIDKPFSMEELIEFLSGALFGHEQSVCC
jgi:CheY-like chemotaxis protein